MRRPFRSDQEGMSETIGVAVLLGLTIIVTVVVGLNVLVVGEDNSGAPQANFTYDYVGSSDLLIITHSRGDSFEAGNLDLEGPSRTVTWAESANSNDTEMVGPGDITQLAPSNAYGQRVRQNDQIIIYHNATGNRTQLDQWP